MRICNMLRHHFISEGVRPDQIMLQLGVDKKVDQFDSPHPEQADGG